MSSGGACAMRVSGCAELLGELRGAVDRVQEGVDVVVFELGGEGVRVVVLPPAVQLRPCRKEGAHRPPDDDLVRRLRCRGRRLLRFLAACDPGESLLCQGGELCGRLGLDGGTDALIGRMYRPPALMASSSARAESRSARGAVESSATWRR